ncbi:MAG: thermonuclease family protein [Pseudomonadota bacterium]
MKLLIYTLVILFSIPAFGAGSALNSYECEKSKIKYDDGDSFTCGEEQIRVLGMDTPEITHKEHGISIDQPFGREATKMTNDLLKAAKRVIIIRSKKDMYGRTLAHVLIDGELLSVKLIKASLAYETISHYGDNGFREFALQITEAAKSAPKPKFDPPYLWRRKHQKK